MARDAAHRARLGGVTTGACEGAGVTDGGAWHRWRSRPTSRYGIRNQALDRPAVACPRGRRPASLDGHERVSPARNDVSPKSSLQRLFVNRVGSQRGPARLRGRPRRLPRRSRRPLDPQHGDALRDRTRHRRQDTTRPSPPSPTPNRSPGPSIPASSSTGCRCGRPSRLRPVQLPACRGVARGSRPSLQPRPRPVRPLPGAPHRATPETPRHHGRKSSRSRAVASAGSPRRCCN